MTVEATKASRVKVAETSAYDVSGYLASCVAAHLEEWLTLRFELDFARGLPCRGPCRHHGMTDG